MASWYRHYRGRSTGRVLHFLYHYCGFDVAKHAVVDFSMDEVTLYGNLFASFTWSDRFGFGEADVPRFTFGGADYATYEANQRDKHEAAIIDVLPDAPEIVARTPVDVAVLEALNPEMHRRARLWSQGVHHAEPAYFVAEMMMYDHRRKVIWCKAGDTLYYWHRELGAWLRGPKDGEAS